MAEAEKWLSTVAKSGKYSDLLEKPLSLKNPSLLTVSVNGKETSYDGSQPKTITLNASELNTYTKEEIDNKTGSADKVTIQPIPNLALDAQNVQKALEGIYKKAEEAFTGAADVKSKVATAINNKGGSANGDMTGDQLASAINAIESKKEVFNNYLSGLFRNDNISKEEANAIINTITMNNWKKTSMKFSDSTRIADSAIINNKIMHFCGRSSSSSTNAISSVDSFDITTGKSATLRSFPQSSADMQVFKLPDGKAYFIGMCTMTSKGYFSGYSRSMYSYNANEDTYNSLASSPVFLASDTAIVYVPERNSFFVGGGCEDTSRDYDYEYASLAEYNIGNNTWRTIVANKYERDDGSNVTYDIARSIYYYKDGFLYNKSGTCLINTNGDTDWDYKGTKYANNKITIPSNYIHINRYKYCNNDNVSVGRNNNKIVYNDLKNNVVTYGSRFGTSPVSFDYMVLYNNTVYGITDPSDGGEVYTLDKNFDDKLAQ